MDKNLLVKRAPSYYHNPELGLLEPIAYIDENGLCEPIHNVQKDFPNGKIWISKGFMDLSTRIGDDELFILERYEISGEDWQENSSKHKFYSFGNAAKKLNPHEFIPVVQHDSLPNKATGLLFSDIDIPISSYFFIFIKNENAIYGPFRVLENKQEKSKILSIPPQTPLNLPQDNIAKYDYQTLLEKNELITLSIDNDAKIFIRKTHNLRSIKYESIDFISDKNLIKLFMTQGFLKEGKNAFGKAAVRNLQKSIEEYGSEKIKFFENTDRFERVKKLLSDFLTQADYGQKIVDEFLFTTDGGKVFLNDYFEKHKDRLIKDKREELEKEISEKKTKLLGEIDKLEEQKKNKKEELIKIQENVHREADKAKVQIDKIKQQTEEETHQELSKKQKELLEKMNNLELEIKELEEKKTKFYDEQNKIQTYQDLVKRTNYYEERIKELIEKETDIKKAVETQQNLLASPSLGDELVKFKTIKSVLENKSSYPNEDLNIFLIKSNDFNLIENRKDFIENLVNSFSKDNSRSFTYDEIANLLICLSQSFLTILSGPPGTGKTSTALRLAKFLGLVSDSNKTSRNFLNIAVGRGWTSSRDILGFYNSLKDVYQPSRTGLYQFLKKHSNEEFQDEKFLKLVLMDEANLSSIEHYWSDFLAMCDTDIAKTAIDLGIPDPNHRYLNIPDSLRFIATINNDDTTEKLSPRLIDRSPIISLSYSYDDVNEEYDDEISFDIGAVTYDNLKESFDISINEAKLDGEEQVALDKIIELLRDSRFNSKTIEISHRKRNAIYKYCYIANQLNFEIKPMDFAISQHILPLINGSGSAFKERLENLQIILEQYGYLKSKKILDTIFNTSEYDFYSFF